VPTNIDAILFWQVHDPERAALEITDYRQAIGRVAQTSLRENDRLLAADHFAVGPQEAISS